MHAAEFGAAETEPAAQATQAAAGVVNTSALKVPGAQVMAAQELDPAAAWVHAAQGLQLEAPVAE